MTTPYPTASDPSIDMPPSPTLPLYTTDPAPDTAAYDHPPPPYAPTPEEDAHTHLDPSSSFFDRLPT